MTTPTNATEYLAALLADGFTPSRWDMKAHRQIEKGTGSKRIKVCFDADDATFSVIAFDGQLTEWEARFTADTPLAVVNATVIYAVASM